MKTGFINLKKWLEERGQALFSRSARKFGIPEPRGILLLGPTGTGKSLTAKIVSTFWQLPLLKLDFGEIFSGLAAPEENMREALKIAEGLSPSVLWVDEIEKGMTEGEGPGLYGIFLNWMAW